MSGKNIFKVLALVLISSLLVLPSGCRADPIISEDEISAIQADLGYVIAPTWLPEGFELMDVYEHTDGDIAVRSAGELTYTGSQVVVFLRYPADAPTALSGTNWLFETLNLGWRAPEDAIEMIEVNERDGYFIRGSWSAEVLKAITELDEEKLHSITPDWDYDFAKSVYFEFELSSKEVIKVSLSAIYHAELINREELIRIAESCVQVE